MHNIVMMTLKMPLLLIVTALCEIIGCYNFYLWLRMDKTALYLIPSAIFLALFSWLLTFHPSYAGRVYAIYGGVYVAVSILWLWLFEKQTPTTWDLSGGLLVITGAVIIAYGSIELR